MPKKKSISTMRLYDAAHTPLDADEAANAEIYFMRVIARVQHAKHTDNVPMRPADFGQIRELIAAAVRQWFMPDDAPLAAPIPELFHATEEGNLVYRSGRAPSPREEALEMLYQCQAALEFRRATIKDYARRAFCSAIRKPYTDDTDQWRTIRQELETKRAALHAKDGNPQPSQPVYTPLPPAQTGRLEDYEDIPGLSSVDLGVSRLIPRLKALIRDLLAGSLILSEKGTIVEASPTPVERGLSLASSPSPRTLSPQVGEDRGTELASASDSKDAQSATINPSDSSSPSPSASVPQASSFPSPTPQPSLRRDQRRHRHPKHHPKHHHKQSQAA